MNQLIRFYNERKLLLGNFFSLGVLQLTNYLVPLLIIPYVIRIIGIEKFGMVSIAQAIAVFGGVVVDYGYNLTSTRDISLNRNNFQRLQEIFSITIFGKFFLFLFGFAFLITSSFVVHFVREEWVLFFGAYTLVLGQLLFPVWLYQGLEKMKYIALFNAAAKVISLILVFMLIKEERDYQLVILCTALGSIFMSLVSYYIVYKHLYILPIRPTLRSVIDSLKQGFPIFSSNVSVAFYSTSTILILGVFTNNTIVGYYSTAEKVMMIPRQVAGIFSQAIYPQICQIAVKGWGSLRIFWRSWFLIFLFAILILCLGVFFMAEKLTLLLTGQIINEITQLIQILIIVPIAVALNVYSYLILLAFDYRRQIMHVMFPVAIFNIALCFILSFYFDASGTAWSLVITEILIAILLYFKLKKYVIKFDEL